MSRHDDILTELGLAPTWQRRARPGLGRGPEALVAPAPSPPSLLAASEVTAPASAEARIVRIAALEWRDFAADVDVCVACGLSRTRKKTVPGVGDTRAEWLFIGEAPGAEEDARGEPFVGQAGKLLDNMLAALGKSAATTLLGIDATIASLRGRVHRYGGLPLVVTYHPAYLLRNLPDKAKAWEDLLLARRTLRGAANPRRPP